MRELQYAREAIQAGSHGRARNILNRLVAADPDNAEAWHLFSLIATDDAQRKIYEQKAYDAGYIPDEPPPVAPPPPAQPQQIYQQPVYQQPQPQVIYIQPSKKSSGLIPALLLSAVGVCGLIYFLGVNAPDKPTDPYWEVLVLCRDAVKAQLKSPSSAEFPVVDAEKSVDREGRIFTLRSHVDADNSFGANIRTTWTCIMDYDEASQTYSLVSLDM
jgi:hypothetical protein